MTRGHAARAPSRLGTRRCEITAVYRRQRHVISVVLVRRVNEMMRWWSHHVRVVVERGHRRCPASAAMRAPCSWSRGLRTSPTRMSVGILAQHVAQAVVGIDFTVSRPTALWWMNDRRSRWSTRSVLDRRSPFPGSSCGLIWSIIAWRASWTSFEPVRPVADTSFHAGENARSRSDRRRPRDRRASALRQACDDAAPSRACRADMKTLAAETRECGATPKAKSISLSTRNAALLLVEELVRDFAQVLRAGPEFVERVERHRPRRTTECPARCRCRSLARAAIIFSSTARMFMPPHQIAAPRTTPSMPARQAGSTRKSF